MKTWELKRGQDVLATISAENLMLPTPKSQFIQTIKTPDGKMIATLYLASNVFLVEVAQDKSLQPEK